MSIESKVVNAINNIEDDVKTLQVHPLKNKWITIIGDAFCSYKDWCRANGFGPYPYKDCGFSTVEGMWWHQLIKNTGAKLCRVAAGPGWDATQQYYTFGAGATDPYKWYISNGSTYTDIDGNNHTAGETIYPDVVIIMCGGWTLKKNGSTEIYHYGTGTGEIEESDMPLCLTNASYEATNNASWKGHYNQLVGDIVSTLHSTGKHIQIFLCDPTYFRHESGYNPRRDNKRYQMSKAIDEICEYWNIARIPTMTYIIGGNYGSGSDTCAVNGGGGETFYLPNLQGMARLAKGIEGYLSILVHPNYTIYGTNPVIEDIIDPNDPNMSNFEEVETPYIDEFFTNPVAMGDNGEQPVIPGN